MVESVYDLLGRYTPPVKKHRVKVKFVPVFDGEEKDMQKKSLDRLEYKHVISTLLL